jgi:hypothetical protein
MKARLFYRSVLFLAAAAVLTGVSGPPEPPKIHIYSCQVLSGLRASLAEDEVGLAVRFENDSPDPLSSIVWRAKYGPYDVDFIDDGTFASGTRIDNFVAYERGKTLFNSGAALQDIAAILLRVPSAADRKAWVPSITLGTFASTEDPANCAIVRATFAGGDTWVNSALSQAVAPFPVPTATPKPARGASPAPSPTPDPPSPPGPPVTLKGCVLEVTGRPILYVKFHNVSAATFDRVIVRVPYSGSSVDFVDQGSYAPGVTVTHTLKGTPDSVFRSRMYFMGEPDACDIVSVHFADNTTWQNPDVDASMPPLPTPVPDAIDFLKTRVPRWQVHGQPSPMPTAPPTIPPD